MNLQLLNIDGKFKLLKEHRGPWAVKQYLHRWYIYQGQEVFVKFRHKHNRTKVEVATHQHLVDELKPLFGLRQIGTRIVSDKEEGIGVMQKWWPNVGTVKMRHKFQHWLDEKGLFELLKICLFDGIIGSLDRHGNNVLVLEDRGLLTIDDEDVFYPAISEWVRFDKDLRHMAYFAYLKNKELYRDYVTGVKKHSQKIMSMADVPVMKNNPQYKFYAALEKNVGSIDKMAELTVEQLLR